MSKKKILHINTGMFALDIYYNGVYVGSQITIWLGLLLFKLFSRNDAVHRLVFVFFVINLLVLLFCFFNGASVSLEEVGDESTDSEKKDSSPPEKEEMDVEVDHTKKKKKPHKSQKELTIKNKVPLPDDTKVTEVKEEIPEQDTKPEPPAPEPPVPPPVKEQELPPIKPMEEMSEDDWKDVFGTV